MTVSRASHTQIENGRLKIVTGTSSKLLVQEMIQELAKEPLAPFDDEMVVIQSLGLARWVRQQMAEAQGCAASVHLQFPTAFCRSLASLIQPYQEIDARFSEESMPWSIESILRNPETLQQSEYSPLRTYLADANPPKRYALANQIARRFVEYGLYRPQMLLGWEIGEDRETFAATNPHYAWQKSLWRTLTASEEPWHFARWFIETTELLEKSTEAPHGLPKRLSVFGIPTLPPLFVRLLSALARFCTVSFYILRPEHQSLGEPPTRTIQSSGLSLSLGLESKDLIDLLSEYSKKLSLEVNRLNIGELKHLKPKQDEMQNVRAPLLEVVHGALHNDSLKAAPYELDAQDKSLLVHDCHSPLREVEVLRDQILDAFALNPELRPHDILVMVPDVDLYGPLVQSVFAPNAGDDRIRIPYQVADRSLSKSSEVVQACSLLLNLVTSRQSVTEVLHLLSLQPVRTAQGISSDQLLSIEQFVQSANINWGWDGEERATNWDLPPFSENSWRSGIQGLLVGYATGPNSKTVHAITPIAGDLSSDSELLGIFAEWMGNLHKVISSLRVEGVRSLSEWSFALEDAFAWLVKPEGGGEQTAMATVRRTLQALRELPLHAMKGGEASGELKFEVIRDWINDKLASDEYATQFLVGGMTICAMKPMRSIPHRFIAMLGLSDANFPRRENRPAFDLIGFDRQSGDRDLQADDRQLVLDTMLCAQERLHLSYVGRSLQKNSAMAPSVIIDELFMWLSDVLEMPDSVLHDALAIRHHLQPFNVEYFRQQARYFSYNKINEKAAIASLNPQPETPFVADNVILDSTFDTNVSGPDRPDALVPQESLATATREPRIVIELQDLIDAWRNPSEFHAKRILGLSFPTYRDELSDDEPMEVDNLLAYNVRREMIVRMQQTRRDRSIDMMSAEWATRYLPPAHLGRAWTRNIHEQVEQLMLMAGSREYQEPASVDIEGNGWRLVGRLDSLVGNELVFIKPGVIKARDLIDIWIRHLVAVLQNPQHTTIAIGFKDSVRFSRVTDPLSYLNELIAAYRLMLVRPVAYFPNAADECRKLLGDIDRAEDFDKAVANARKAFMPRYVAPGGRSTADIDDPYVALLWRGRDPFERHAEEFMHFARCLWLPLDAAYEAYDPLGGQI